MSHISESSIISVETSSVTLSPNQKITSLIDSLRSLLTNDFDLLMEDKKLIDEFIKIVNNLKQLKPHLDVKQMGLFVSVQILANSFKTNVPFVLDSFQNFDYTHETDFDTIIEDQLTYLCQGEQYLHEEIAILIEKESSISKDIASIDKHNVSLEEEVAKKKGKRNKIIEVMEKKNTALDKIAAEVSEIKLVCFYKDREQDDAGENFDVACEINHDMKEAWNNVKDLLDLM